MAFLQKILKKEDGLSAKKNQRKEKHFRRGT